MLGVSSGSRKRADKELTPPLLQASIRGLWLNPQRALGENRMKQEDQILGKGTKRPTEVEMPKSLLPANLVCGWQGLTENPSPRIMREHEAKNGRTPMLKR
jgi:hypothetical protein